MYARSWFSSCDRSLCGDLLEKVLTRETEQRGGSWRCVYMQFEPPNSQAEQA